MRLKVSTEISKGILLTDPRSNPSLLYMVLTIQILIPILSNSLHEKQTQQGVKIVASADYQEIGAHNYIPMPNTTSSIFGYVLWETQFSLCLLSRKGKSRWGGRISVAANLDIVR